MNDQQPTVTYGTIDGVNERYQRPLTPNHFPEIGGLAAMAKRNHTSAVRRKPARELSSWQHAKRRCFETQSPKYRYYGGRGITMCERWRNSYAAFLADMGRCPAGSTLERRDNDGNYEPGNCVWATRKEQSLNRSSNVNLDVPRVLDLLKAGMGPAALGRMFQCSHRTIQRLAHKHGFRFTSGRKLVQR
jgi:hypothetical protein